MVKLLPIGIDSFREIRETDRYYIDKTLLIKDFIKRNDKVALITRPRRFGKTLNMTTLREFFDITADSRAIFAGLSIMDTEYSCQINSRPVIFLSFKDCKADTVKSLVFKISTVVLFEYDRYWHIFKGNVDESKTCYFTFFMIYEKLRDRSIDKDFLEISIATLAQAAHDYFGIKPIALIDEYDQPIVSAIEYGYHEKIKTFFSGFYGAALKGQENLHQALITGIQRVVKESIFSQLNNVKVYNVTNEFYSDYFGLTPNETEGLLNCYGLELSEPVRQMYDGYLFGKTEIYNPWSILYYAETKQLDAYWINTSSNSLIWGSIADAGDYFRNDFDRLIINGAVEINANLECSFIELKHHATLWGLLINAGYLTVVEKTDKLAMTVRIPNGEVRSEFLQIVAEHAKVRDSDLSIMFRCLLAKNMEGFMAVYRELVLSCTSYFDADENAYHMLFLGMCISLNNLYKITSNIESGFGRSDIHMQSLSTERPHIIIEFKQGEAVDQLKQKALQQILKNRYYDGLTGEILCLGIAHNKRNAR